MMSARQVSGYQYSPASLACLLPQPGRQLGRRPKRFRKVISPGASRCSAATSEKVLLENACCVISWLCLALCSPLGYRVQFNPQQVDEKYGFVTTCGTVANW